MIVGRLGVGLVRDEVAWASASYDRSTGFDKPAVIIVMGRVMAADEQRLQALAQSFLRTAWESDVPRIGRLTVELRSEDDRALTYREVAISRDELEERFGPRAER